MKITVSKLFKTVASISILGVALHWGNQVLNERAVQHANEYKNAQEAASLLDLAQNPKLNSYADVRIVSDEKGGVFLRRNGETPQDDKLFKIDNVKSIGSGFFSATMNGQDITIQTDANLFNVAGIFDKNGNMVNINQDGQLYLEIDNNISDVDNAQKFVPDGAGGWSAIDKDGENFDVKMFEVKDNKYNTFGDGVSKFIIEVVYSKLVKQDDGTTAREKGKDILIVAGTMKDGQLFNQNGHRVLIGDNGVIVDSKQKIENKLKIDNTAKVETEERRQHLERITI